ncbi:DUF6274 family protein [Streptomyces sp. NPDC087897]|uniref:DUF6274 family protein n=1 Tax=Streptomyces sp. NPDC087897 TaxID=3365817 RepID=UPI0037F95ACB
MARLSASTARHEIRALLRAHLAAASAYRHFTRHCAVCHRLLRLAMEPGGDGERAASAPPSAASGAARSADGRGEGPERRAEDSAGRPDGGARDGRAPAGKRTGHPEKRSAAERAGAERPSPT